MTVTTILVISTIMCLCLLSPFVHMYIMYKQWKSKHQNTKERVKKRGYK